MKKIVRLTESELKNIVETSVQRAIREGVVTEGMLNEGIKDKAVELAKIAGVSVLVAAGWLAQIGLGGGTTDNDTTSNGMNQVANDLKQYPDTISQGDIATGKFESRIRRAVMESIQNLMRG